ncbi:MAG: glycosyltransferase family 2 protein [Gammaproteobacteria bacterium]
MNRLNEIANKTVFISCVVPVYNEEANILPFFTELRDKLASLTTRFEMIAINDGSRDNSQTQLRLAHQQLGVKVLQFSRNFGKETAITAGLDFTEGDVTIIMDADFQHPFVTFDAFLAKWAEGYDMVYGLRTSRDDEKALKRLFANTFYRLMLTISNADIPADAGDFRLLDRKVVDALKQTKERVRFMKGLYSWVGFKSIGIPFDVQDRAAGKSSWRFMKLLDLAITGIVSFSDIPLRAWSIIGFVISCLAFLSIIYTIIDTLLFGVTVPGYATLLIVVTFFGGIQLLSVGILGEYVARIFNEVKQRPTYLLNEKLGFEAKSSNS